MLGVGIASWGSRTLAPEVYLSFFSDSVSTRVEQAVAQSGGDIAAAVQGLDFLPESIRAALAAGLQTAGDQLPEKINALLEPLFLPLVQALLFVLLCMIVRWVFALLVRLLRGVNLIPLVGGANRLLGLVLGLVTGAFDCWLLAMLLWFAASIHHRPDRLADHRRFAAQRRVQPFLVRSTRFCSIIKQILNKPRQNLQFGRVCLIIVV